MKLEIQDGGLTNPMTTQGDIIIGGASGSPTRLAGAVGVLQGAAGSGPSYTQAPTLTTPSMTTPTISTSINLTGGQIAFPSTAVPSADTNTLDDYEEGTWTPTYFGTSTAGVTTYGVQVGTYTKIGNRVIASAHITWTAQTGTGNGRMGGLPFASSGTANTLTPVTIYNSNYTIPASSVLQAYKDTSTTNIILINSALVTGADAEMAIDTAAGLIVSVSYIV